MREAYTVAGPLLRHYRRTARDLPWRRTKDPYAVLVSEVMLQQTQVARVVGAYGRFLRRFPTLAALAAAPLGAVLREWSGLGYNRRARDLHRAARACPQGLPADVGSLDALPGVGPYTAGAVACFAFGARVAFADTNIRRVLGRLRLGRIATEREAIALDRALLPKAHADLWHHALMDLGATTCRKQAPHCESCPLNEICVTSAASGTARVSPGRAASRLRGAAGGPLRRGARQPEAQPAAERPGTHAIAPAPVAYRDSDRRIRGAIVRALTQAPSLGLGALEKEIGDERVHRLADALVADGLVERSGRRYRLPG